MFLKIDYIYGGLVSYEFPKMTIIESLQYLTKRKLIMVYAFVIMPNHLHLIWELSGMNGKESPKASLVKYTAHEFKKKLILKATLELSLQDFCVDKDDRQFEFWQRDALAIPVYTRQVILQKLAYIHNNPVVKKWDWAPSPEAYRFSSASFYTTWKDEFGILISIADLL